MNTQASAKYELLDHLADEFAERFRRGERPAIKEYIERYPELAAEIAELLPALVEIAQVDEGRKESTAILRMKAPEQVGDYRLVREIGRGGMGIVYEAEQISLGRHVALRILPQTASKGGKALERFKREARSAARLHHTNIVPVFEVGQDGDLCYYAMQFIQGQGLDQVVGELRRHRHNGVGSAPVDDAPGPRCEGSVTALTIAERLLTGCFDVQASPDAATIDHKPEAPAQDAPALALQACVKDAPALALQACVKDDPALALQACVPVDRAQYNGAGNPANASTLTFAEPGLEQSARPSCPPAPSAASSPNTSELSTLTDLQYYRRIAGLGVQLGEGLAYAHKQGILHRDIKPSNLLLDSRSTLWITDFGLARAEGTAELTGPGEIVGTFRYMAPERFQGRGDVRSDIYSAGATLYEMLTLEPIFPEPDRGALMSRVMLDEPVRPRRLDPHIPRDLETIVLKALAKEPGRRYALADDLAGDLRRFLDGEPIRARRTSLVERGTMWCRRNPSIAVLAGAVFLLLVCLAAGSMVVAFRLDREKNALDTEKNALIAAEKDSAEKLYDSLVAQAEASHSSRQIGQRFDTLEAVRKAAQLVRERHMPAERLGRHGASVVRSDELRNLAIAALALPDFKILRTWEGFPAGSYYWDVDVQGRLYARSVNAGFISLRRIDTDEEIARLGGWRAVTWVRFSPGGGFLLAWSGAEYRIWDVLAGPPQIRLKGEGDGIQFHPDGRHLLVRQSDSSLWIHDLEAAQQKRLFLKPQQPLLNDFVFDFAGNRLVVLSSDKVQILDMKTGKILSSILELSPVHFAAWHPSGNYLALVCSLNEIHVWDLKRMRRISVLKGCRNSGIGVAFTPDGDRLISNGWEGVLRLWDWRTGRELLRHAAGWSTRFCKDGSLPICVENRLGFLELTTGREHRSFVQQSNAGKDVAYWKGDIHPEGRLLALAMTDQARLFDLETGDELAALPFSGYCIAFQGKEALLTNGPDGLLRWPIQGKIDSNRLRIGPPERLHISTPYDFACSRNGKLIGQVAGNGAFLVRPGHAPTVIGPHQDARHIAISPDGLYAATGVQGGDEGVKLWDTNTGRMLRQFPVGGSSGACFSPDGQWLALGGSRASRLVKVVTWEEQALPSWDQAAFSPDGSVFAFGKNQGVAHLLNLTTGRELARLEEPFQDRCGFLAFTPDGTKLINITDDGTAIHVWDIRLIRKQLVEIGLDWDAPALVKASESELAAAKTPLQVEIDPPDLGRYMKANALILQALRHEDAKQFAEALKLLREALKIDTTHAQAHDELAWLLVTGPVELRQPRESLDLARKAVALAPERGNYQNTLGVALYRNGHFAEALPVLEKSRQLSNGQNEGHDLFFLAMCHHRLGHAKEARECQRQAVEWFQKKRSQLPAHWVTELTAFQSEAEDELKTSDEKRRSR